MKVLTLISLAILAPLALAQTTQPADLSGAIRDLQLRSVQLETDQRAIDAQRAAILAERTDVDGKLARVRNAIYPPPVVYFDATRDNHYDAKPETSRANRAIAAIRGVQPMRWVYAGSGTEGAEATKYAKWLAGTNTPIVQDFNEQDQPRFYATLARWQSDKAGCQSAIANHLAWVKAIRAGDPGAVVSLYDFPAYGTTNLAGEAEYLAACKPVVDLMDFYCGSAGYTSPTDTLETWEARVRQGMAFADKLGKPFCLVLKPHVENYSVNPPTVAPNPLFPRQLQWARDNGVKLVSVWVGYADLPQVGADNIDAIRRFVQ